MSRISKVTFVKSTDLRLTPAGAGMDGRLGTIYIATDVTPNRLYTWNGTHFVTEGQGAAQPVTITGVKAAGSVLTANINSGWTVTAYQWRRNGVNISGATSQTYTQVLADESATLECLVTVSAYSASLFEAVVAPTFTTHPDGAVANLGATVTLVAAAAGSPVPSYQWFRDGSPIAGATSASYTTPAFTQADTHASFWCVASNSGGYARSRTAQIVANDVSASLAIVGGMPETGVVGVGYAGGFYAMGGRRPYTFSIASGSLPSGLTLSASDGAIYGTPASVGTSTIVVRVTDADGTTANASAVTVAIGTGVILPSITVQPTAETINVGGSVTLAVQAAGTAPLTYQWRKGGANISGATGSTYTILGALASDAGSYSVVVSNSAGSVSSASVALAVNVVAPAIVANPQSIGTAEGAIASFRFIVSGTAPITYQWKKNGADISGATASTYLISSVAASDVAGYTCTATNSAGSVTSAAAQLSISASAPSITGNPTSTAVTDGANVTFTVIATGSAPLTYQWRFNGVNISGATSAAYTVTGVTASHVGSYDVVVSNASGSVLSAPAVLTVSANAPVITTQPSASTVNEGTAATFTVVASGSGLTYQWQKDGVNIAGAVSATYTIASAGPTHVGAYRVVVSNSGGSVTSSSVGLLVSLAAPVITTQPAGVAAISGNTVSFTVVASGSSLAYQWRKNGAAISGATTATYSIGSVVSGDAGAYSVVVSNTGGTVTSASATLSVGSSDTAPTITAQPVGGLIRLTGASASFSVTATGTNLTYQWRRDGVMIVGETASTLTIASTAQSNDGTYTVVITNSAGTVTSNGASLRVAPPNALTDDGVPIMIDGEFITIESDYLMIDGQPMLIGGSPLTIV